MPLAEELWSLAAGIKESLVMGLDSEQQAIMRAGMLTMIANMDDMLARLPATELGEEVDTAS
jgi:hypothetical protein